MKSLCQALYGMQPQIFWNRNHVDSRLDYYKIPVYLFIYIYVFNISEHDSILA